MWHPVEDRQLAVLDRAYEVVKPFDANPAMNVSLVLRRIRVYVRADRPGLREALRAAFPGYRAKVIVDPNLPEVKSTLYMRPE